MSKDWYILQVTWDAAEIAAHYVFLHRWILQQALFLISKIALSFLSFAISGSATTQIIVIV